jgi:uncharacterized linocin/CFP29 family protein
MFVDYVLNGEGFGSVGQQLSGVRFEPALLRPTLNSRGQKCVVLNQKGKPSLVEVRELQARGIDSPAFYVSNATTLTKEAWVDLDRKIIRATRQRLRAWTDLSAAAGRTIGNAMGRMTLEYQAMTDAGEAVVDMDALVDARADRPLFNLKSVPLPITHSDFYFSQREIAVSRQSGAPLDTTMAEAAGRRVAEMIEKTLIGVETGVTFGTRSGDSATAHTGTSTVYGYTNFPYRVTKTDLTTPTGSNPEGVMTDVLEMIETMQSNGFFGPYMLYHSTGYSRYLNDDYFRSGSTSAVRSLRQRIMEIEGIQDIRRLDFLTSGYQMILVQMDPEVAEAINGMDVTTVQWESQGGMRQNFKVMCIQVPLLKSPYNGVAGIIHGTTS